MLYHTLLPSLPQSYFSPDLHVPALYFAIFAKVTESLGKNCRQNWHPLRWKQNCVTWHVTRTPFPLSGCHTLSHFAGPPPLKLEMLCGWHIMKGNTLIGDMCIMQSWYEWTSELTCSNFLFFTVLPCDRTLTVSLSLLNLSISPYGWISETV